MGEANELSQQEPNCHITYRAVKTPDGHLMCHVYELDKKIKEMTLDELCKEYNAILTKFNQRSNQNYWERLNQPKNVKLKLKLKEKKEVKKGKASTPIFIDPTIEVAF